WLSLGGPDVWILGLFLSAFATALLRGAPLFEFFGYFRWILLIYSLYFLFKKLDLPGQIGPNSKAIYLIILGVVGLYAFQQFWTGFEFFRGANKPISYAIMTPELVRHR